MPGRSAAVVSREVLHRSPVLLTPYRQDGLIDVQELERFIDRSYEEAGLKPAPKRLRARQVGVMTLAIGGRSEQEVELQISVAEFIHQPSKKPLQISAKLRIARIQSARMFVIARGPGRIVNDG